LSGNRRGNGERGKIFEHAIVVGVGHIQIAGTVHRNVHRIAQAVRADSVGISHGDAVVAVDG